MAAVTVDTNILVWGVRKLSENGPERCVERATALLTSLDLKGIRVVLTAPVISEYLVGGTKEQRARQFASLEAKHAIIDFDAKAAKIAAELYSDTEFVKSLGEAAGKTRNAVKADFQIVACAIAAGLERIYSDDIDIKNIARRAGFPFKGLPDLAEGAPEMTTRRASESKNLFEESPES